MAAVISAHIKPPLIEWGVSSVTMAGEEQSGDLHLVRPFTRGTLTAVVDGAGHGKEAAAAARIAIETIDKNAEEDVVAIMRFCHERLKGTRGAVIGLGSFNGGDHTITWLGVGNIGGMLVRSGLPSREEQLLVRAGLVGFGLPPLQASVTRVARHDLLIVTTDGIRPDFPRSFAASERPARIASLVSSGYATRTADGLISDDGLVLIARYLPEASRDLSEGCRG